MADSFHSLYSDNQNHHSSSKASPPMSMSAIGLLQKAVQMGSTTSNPTFFDKTIGVMMSSSSPSSSSTNTLPFAQRGSELHQVFGEENPTEKDSNRMMNFSSTNNVMISNSLDHHQPINGVQISQSAANSLNLHSGLHGVENSLTRDFLGMGREGGRGRPFLPQELATFASMGSAMGLDHFTSNH